MLIKACIQNSRMKNKLNIALVGLGQVGNYLMNELNLKKKILN